MRRPSHFPHLIVGMGGPLIIGLLMVVLDLIKPQAFAQKVPALPSSNRPIPPPGVQMMPPQGSQYDLMQAPGGQSFPPGIPTVLPNGQVIMMPVPTSNPPAEAKLALPKPSVYPAAIKTSEPPLGSSPSPSPLPVPAIHKEIMAKKLSEQSQRNSLDLLAGIIEDYFYSPSGKRDPFLPTEVIGNIGTVAGPIFPLENYDLSQLKLVGIIWEVRAPKAMLLDPSGKGYVVKVGDRVGRHNGHVAKIRESEIVIVENDEGPDGKITHQTKTLRLQVE